jgi:hypothetical protein
MNTTHPPSPEVLRALLSYDPEEGSFTWKPRPLGLFPDDRSGLIWNTRFAGKKAGCFKGTGQLVIGIFGCLTYAHRIAWAIQTGAWPSGDIDHIDGDPSNNRFANLRDVSRSVNLQNQRRAHVQNETGLLGVSPCKKSGRFYARIVVSGRQRNLGLSDTPEAAHAAYIKAKRELHAGGTL